METIYMNMPELPRTRHIVVGNKHIVNVAAPETKIFHRVERRERAQQNDVSNSVRGIIKDSMVGK